jgi:hypothetical protein
MNYPEISMEIKYDTSINCVSQQRILYITIMEEQDVHCARGSPKFHSAATVYKTKRESECHHHPDIRRKMQGKNGTLGKRNQGGPKTREKSAVMGDACRRARAEHQQRPWLTLPGGAPLRPHLAPPSPSICLPTNKKVRSLQGLTEERRCRERVPLEPSLATVVGDPRRRRPPRPLPNCRHPVRLGKKKLGGRQWIAWTGLSRGGGPVGRIAGRARDAANGRREEKRGGRVGWLIGCRLGGLARCWLAAG